MGDLKLNGATSGTITLTPAAVAGTNTITLPATTGTLALTASPTFSGTVTATTITSPAATALTIQSAGTTAMTIDTSQNVGIGTTSPQQKFVVSNAGAEGLEILPAINSGESRLQSYNRSGAAYNRLSTISSDFVVYTNGGATTGMVIESGGNIQIGGANGTNRINVSWNPTTTSAIVAKSTNETYNGSPMVFQNSSGGTAGFIGQSTSAVSYNTSSDYRLKENVAPLGNGLATIIALKPVTYDWKIDGSSGEGFIAHEIQSIVPHAVTGEKDAVNEDGSIRPQGVDYSKIVVHLVAACQELSAKNDALEARLAALEAK